MKDLQKKVLVGGLDADSAPHLVANDSYVNAINARMQTTEDGLRGAIQYVMGTTQHDVSQTYKRDDFTSQCVGAYEDRKTGRVYFFMGGSEYVLCWFPDGGVRVVYTPDGPQDLDFDRVTGVAMIGDMLYWTDGNTEPRCINVESALAFYDSEYTPLNGHEAYPEVQKESSLLMKRGPLTAPQVSQLHTSGIEADNLVGSTYTFAYRYVYLDGQMSVFSPASEMVPEPGPTEPFPTNKIVVTIPDQEVLPVDLKWVQFAVRYNDEQNYFVVKTIKDALYSTALELVYDKSESQIAVSVEDSTRQYDSVPLTAQALETQNSRLFLGNINEGLDLNILPQGQITQGVTGISGGASPVGHWLELQFKIRVVRQSYFTGEVFNIDHLQNVVVLAIDNVQVNNISYSGLWWADTANVSLSAFENEALPEVLAWFPAANKISDHLPSPQNGTSPALYAFADTFVQSGTYSWNTAAGRLGPTLADHQEARDQLMAWFVEEVFNPNQYVGGSASTQYVYDFFADDNPGEGWPRLMGEHPTNAPKLISPGLDVQLTDNDRVWKSRGLYKFGYVFFDELGRHAGVTTGPDLVTQIPDRVNNYGVNTGLQFVTSLNFEMRSELSDGSPDFIPPWAHSYEIVRTKNLTQEMFIPFSTRNIGFAGSFVEAVNNQDAEFYDNIISDRRADDGSGTQIWTSEQYLAIQIGDLSRAGYGYRYQEGDRVRIYNANLTTNNQSQYVPRDYEIAKQVGVYLYCVLDKTNNANESSWWDTGPYGQQFSYMDGTTKQFDCEIYRPYQRSDQEVFYGTGATGKVYYPGKSFRAFSPVRASADYLSPGRVFTFPGDVYFRSSFTESLPVIYYRAALSDLTSENDSSRRTSEVTSWQFFAERTNLNIPNYLSWPQVTGRRYIELDQENKTYENSVRYSLARNPLAFFNANSTFLAGDVEDLPQDNGGITKLVNTATTQEEGGVMLAISENETASMYIDEAVLAGSQGDRIVGLSSKVIGSVQNLRGSYGCLHAESVVENNGNVYFWSQNKSTPVKYSTNGLEPLSSYNMVTFFVKKAKELSNRDVHIPGGFNMTTGEYILSFPEDVVASNVYHVSQVDGSYTTPSFKNSKANSFFDDDNVQVYPTNLTLGRSGLKKGDIITNVTVKLTYDSSSSLSTYKYKLFIGDDLLTELVAGAPSAISGEEVTNSVLTHLVTGTNQPVVFKLTDASGTLLNLNDNALYSFTVDVSLTVRRRSSDELYQSGPVTLGFLDGANVWSSKYEYMPECFGAHNNYLVSFSDGDLFVHDNPTNNRLHYGQFPTTVSCIANDKYNVMKVYQHIAFESNLSPDFVDMETELPYLQRTDLLSSDFVRKEGVYYSEILRDRLSPNFGDEVTEDEKLYIGDPMRSQTMKITAEFAVDSEEKLAVRGIDIGTRNSTGHTT